LHEESRNRDRCNDSYDSEPAPPSRDQPSHRRIQVQDEGAMAGDGINRYPGGRRSVDWDAVVPGGTDRGVQRLYDAVRT
jgi:hypothetical protein